MKKAIPILVVAALTGIFFFSFISVALQPEEYTITFVTPALTEVNITSDLQPTAISLPLTSPKPNYKWETTAVIIQNLTVEEATYSPQIIVASYIPEYIEPEKEYSAQFYMMRVSNITPTAKPLTIEEEPVPVKIINASESEFIHFCFGIGVDIPSMMMVLHIGVGFLGWDNVFMLHPSIYGLGTHDASLDISYESPITYTTALEVPYREWSEPVEVKFSLHKKEVSKITNITPLPTTVTVLPTPLSTEINAVKIKINQTKDQVISSEVIRINQTKAIIIPKTMVHLNTTIFENKTVIEPEYSPYPIPEKPNLKVTYELSVDERTNELILTYSLENTGDAEALNVTSIMHLPSELKVSGRTLTSSYSITTERKGEHIVKLSRADGLKVGEKDEITIRFTYSGKGEKDLEIPTSIHWEDQYGNEWGIDIVILITRALLLLLARLPGFEAIFAIIVVIVVAYFIKRKKI